MLDAGCRLLVAGSTSPPAPIAVNIRALKYRNELIITVVPTPGPSLKPGRGTMQLLG
jgi:hypothetical protein